MASASRPLAVATRSRKNVPCWNDFVEHFVKPRRPLLVRGAFANSWCKNWTIPQLLLREQRRLQDLTSDNSSANHLHQHDKDCQVLMPSPQGVNYISQWKSEEVEMPLSDALQATSTGLTPMQYRLDPGIFWEPSDNDALPELLQDDRFDILYDNSFVWVTSASLRTSLHSDPDEGMLAHLSGVKRAVLIAPNVSDASQELLDELLKYRDTSGSIEELYLSNNNPPPDDGSVILASKDVEKYLVELNPGDLLYLPKRWLHDIESTTDTVSLAIRFAIP